MNWSVATVVLVNCVLNHAGVTVTRPHQAMNVTCSWTFSKTRDYSNMHQLVQLSEMGSYSMPYGEFSEDENGTC